jgi:hypothetical protein
MSGPLRVAGPAVRRSHEVDGLHHVTAITADIEANLKPGGEPEHSRSGQVRSYSGACRPGAYSAALTGQTLTVDDGLVMR